MGGAVTAGEQQHLKNQINKNVQNSRGTRSTHVCKGCDRQDAEQHHVLVMFICFAYYVFNIPYFLALNFTDSTTYVSIKG